MIRDAKDKLQGFHAEHSPKSADSPNGHRSHAGTPLEDEEIIKLCRKAKNAPKFEGLFDRGDASGYAGDDSAADQALVSLLSFYTQDPDQLDRLFRQGALCRAKWTGRPDYRERTIRYALDHTTEMYSPGGSKPASAAGARDEAPEGGKGSEKQPPQSEMLVRYASEAHVELFHTPAGDAYATMPVSGASGDHRETHPVRSKGFRQFLRRRFHEDQEKIPGSQAVQDALEQLEGEAQIAGEERPVHVRVAEHEGVIYLDLANARWEVVKIDAGGWRVLSLEDAPVRFRRPRGMLPLPAPKKSADGLAKLRRCINLKDEESWRLIVAVLVAALNPSGPYPVLILQGEQGSAKSTVERLFKASIDPSVAPLRTTPRNEHDLYIGADSSHIVAFDNISNLPPWLSDASCRLSTGGGFSTRTLYENREQELFEGMRPQMMNGISDVATRPDLLDRAVIVTLPRILEEDRRPEADLWRDFEQARPAILGALLDAVSGALHAMPSLNAWCEFRDHHPSKSAKDSRGRPSCSLSQIQKLCSATLAARRARAPLISWGRSRWRPKAPRSLS